MKTTPSIYEGFVNYGQVRALPKKHALLHQGDISEHAYFVKSGCLRMWYNDCGNDYTVKFFIPGDAVASLESFYHATPSKFGIETLAATEVIVVSKPAVTQLLESSAVFKDEMLAISVACMADYQDLFLNRIMKNPQDRYQLLLERHPQLFEIIPHHYIASYLGITPVSLSRIRKRIN